MPGRPLRFLSIGGDFSGSLPTDVDAVLIDAAMIFVEKGDIVSVAFDFHQLWIGPPQTATPVARATCPSDIVAVERLSAQLAVMEAETGHPEGALRIVAIAASAGDCLALARGISTPRLAAIVFAPRDLPPAAISTARGLVLLAATAAGVPALAAVCENYSAEQALADGFAGTVTKPGQSLGRDSAKTSVTSA